MAVGSWCDSCGKESSWEIHADGVAVCRVCGYEREVDAGIKGCELDYRGTTLEGCEHNDPTVWDRRDGSAWCLTCGKWMGFLGKARKQDPTMF